MLTIQEIKSLSDPELQVELAKSKRELVKLKLAVKMGQEKATHKVTAMKKYIAVIKTIIRAFEIEKANQTEPVKA